MISGYRGGVEVHLKCHKWGKFFHHNGCIRLQFLGFDFIRSEEVCSIRVVAGFAGCILWSVFLNVVWCGIHPGWERVEVCQQVFTVELVTCRRNGDMSDGDEPVRSVFRLNGIAADEEGLICSFCLKEWLAAGLAHGHVTAIAARVCDRMTHLAG